jgi:hypothetical protein
MRPELQRQAVYRGKKQFSKISATNLESMTPFF